MNNYSFYREHNVGEDRLKPDLTKKEIQIYENFF